MSIEKLRPSFTFSEKRLHELQQVVPEAFADGKINWDTLREILNADLEDEGRDEYFGLNWPGKREARKRAATPSHGTLVPAPGEGVNEDATENLFIEGDNLEVLKLLQKSYAGKIKMIYIDPPYNTGNDFIYNDDFTDPLEAYLQYTGAKGESGELLTTNTRADGRFHSRWLNMMYPRLILARQLLREDGVIFISIDDNELQNLRQIMNEIFGEENFISNLVWKRKTGSGSQIDKVFSEHEYVLSYAKDSSINQQWRILNDEDGHFTNPDNDTRGPWESCAITAPSKNRNPNQKYQVEVFFSQPNKSIEKNPNLIETFTYGENTIILSKTTKEAENETYYSEQLKYARFIRRWSYVPKSMKEIFNQGKVYLNGGNLPRLKKYKADYEGKALRSIYFSEFSTQQGSSELTELFGKPLVEYPKPLGLLKILLQATTDENDIVLDFFAGSCTTAHAILQMVYDNKSKNPFVIVQLPEATKSDSLAKLDGYLTIAEIGKERIRRVIRRLETDYVKMIPLLTIDRPILDLGFKVYKYSKSNYRKWNSPEEKNIESVTRLFDNLSQPLIKGWQEKNLLVEIFLIEGFPLTSRIIYLEAHLQNQVYRVNAPDFCDHELFVCLDEAIHPVTIDLLKMEKEDIFICLDSALSDELKARVQDKFNVHVI